MTAWRSSLLVLALSLAVAPSARAADTAPDRVLFSFASADIDESSGLVDRGTVVYTINDSGDGAYVYGLDPRTGRTVSRTTYADAVRDVEALAPGAHGTLWTGDTGDNGRDRDHVAVYHVLNTGDGVHPARKFLLRYPDGQHDAETLLVQPGTNQVLVVSKSPFGGTVYAAPRTLRGGGAVNEMRSFAQVSGLVTDGTFFPDGKHVLLRTYGDASVYTYPGFVQVGSVRLPSQPQGEGISMSKGRRVLVSSEGVHSRVLRVTLPRLMASPPAPAPASTPAPSRAAGKDEGGAGVPVVGIGLGVLVVAGLGLLVVRSRRRRS